MPSEAAERAALTVCARAWLRTPYHHRGRVKGAGVDCAMLLAEVYAEAGLVGHLAIPHYPPDWHLHRDAERYLGVLLDHAVEYVPELSDADHPHPNPDPVEWGPTAKSGRREGGELPKRPILPADIALWRFGRCFSHGAIVVDWPIVIHAYLGRGCVLEDAAKAEWLSRIGEGRDAQPKPRPVKFFTLARWANESTRHGDAKDTDNQTNSSPCVPCLRGEEVS
jgi:cell wall-associated NlpC family hydrolase